MSATDQTAQPEQAPAPTDAVGQPIVTEPTDQTQEPVNQDTETSDTQQKMERTWSDIVRRDRELVSRQQHLSQRERELAAIERVARQAKEDPIAALRALGVDPAEALAKYWGPDLLPKRDEQKAGGSDETIREMRERLERAERYAQAAYGQLTRSSEHAEIAREISARPEYDALKVEAEHNGEALYEEIAEIRRQYKQAYGTVPAYEHVLRLANDALAERVATALDRFSSVESVTKRRAKAAQPATKVAQISTQTRALVPERKTLRAEDGASDGFPEAEVRNMPLEERRALALKYMRQAMGKG